MSLYALIVTSILIFAGSMILLIGGSYIAYRLKRRSPYEINS